MHVERKEIDCFGRTVAAEPCRVLTFPPCRLVGRIRKVVTTIEALPEKQRPRFLEREFETMVTQYRAAGIDDEDIETLCGDFRSSLCSALAAYREMTQARGSGGDAA
jgi:Family of unknown function (DUF6074)